MSKNHEKTATTTPTFDLSLAKIWRCLESSCATIWCFSEAFWDKYASFQYRVRHVGAKLSMGMMSNEHIFPVTRGHEEAKIGQMAFGTFVHSHG